MIVEGRTSRSECVSREALFQGVSTRFWATKRRVAGNRFPLKALETHSETLVRPPHANLHFYPSQTKMIGEGGTKDDMRGCSKHFERVRVLNLAHETVLRTSACHLRLGSMHLGMGRRLHRVHRHPASISTPPAGPLHALPLYDSTYPRTSRNDSCMFALFSTGVMYEVHIALVMPSAI